MYAQTKGFEIKTGNITGPLFNQLTERGRHSFLERLKELTLTPSWIPWNLQWWGQDDGSFVCMLEDSGKYKEFRDEEREWQQELLIRIIPIKKIYTVKWYRRQERVELVGFRVVVILKKNDGSPTNFGNEDQQEEFEVRRNNDYTYFKYLHWIFLKIQERWKDYQHKIESRKRVNIKRANANMEPLSLDEIEP